MLKLTTEMQLRGSWSDSTEGSKFALYVANTGSIP